MTQGSNARTSQRGRLRGASDAPRAAAARLVLTLGVCGVLSLLLPVRESAASAAGPGQNATPAPQQPDPAAPAPGQQAPVAPAPEQPAAAAPAPVPPASAVPAPGPPAAPAPTPGAPRVPPDGVALPPGYVIGPEDVLTVFFWRDKDMTTDVTVRPDGKVTLPLLNELTASGRTPEQLRAAITEAAAKFIEDPTVTVVVKQINSRKVYVTGMIGKPGAYPLMGSTTVLQLISMAGGLHEFANAKRIVINRVVNGQPVAIRFNYQDVLKGKNLQQNIELQPGDTVLVP